ncbi:CHAT domain-containing protein [Nostoc sp.]
MAVGRPSLLLAESGNKSTQQEQAEFLTQKGHQQLNLGQYLEAFETWKEAIKICRQLRYEEGVTGNLINQNLALQGSGLYLNACDVLLEALKIDKSDYSSTFYPPRNNSKKALNTAIRRIKPTPVNLLGLQNLGDVLRLLGNLDESELVLKETLSLVQQMTPNQDKSSILISLGDTKQSMYERSCSQYKWIEEIVYQKENVASIQQNALLSIEYYQKANNLQNASVSLRLQAQIQSLRLLVKLNDFLERESKLNNRFTVNTTHINQQIQPLINSIIKNNLLFEQLPVTQSAYAKLNFADSLNKTQNKQLQSVAIQYAKSALQTSQSINNKLLQSFCWGILGKLDPNQSQAYFEQALGFAQSIQAWDVAYQWQQELGDLYSQHGNYKEACDFYEAAITNLNQVRTNLLSSNPDTQFFFYEKVEPVYRNYIRLLAADPSARLEKIIQVNGHLQLEQLKNFLQCGKLNLVPLNSLQELSSTTAIIHIIDLNSTIEVIVQSHDRSLHHNSVDAKLVRSHVNNLLDIVQSVKFYSDNQSEIILHSQKVYDFLIKPIKTYLPSSGTLVFALDTSLQSLPIDLLYDGKEHLTKQYSFAQTVGYKIQVPKSLSKNQPAALIAGLSKKSPSFTDENAPKGLKPLPGVAIEVADIKTQIPNSKVLLDEKFTSLQFHRELSKDDFPIIHISTHGQFSSNSEKTLFLAYDKVINILDFNNFIKDQAQSNENAIELLVLSACQTAKGNKRSALGIAGVAAQAGAQSIIASLWLADESSTAILMQEFYKGLKNGMTKAEALRQAKLSLSSNPKYVHPYFWSGFVLVGGWL